MKFADSITGLKSGHRGPTLGENALHLDSAFLVRQLQAEKAGLKVIYSSGYSTDAITQDLKFSEKANFVQKPYTPRKLARIVRDCLDGEL